MNLFRIFETKYLFKGDEFVGRYDLSHGAVFTFEPGMEKHQTAAFMYLQNHFGAVPKVSTGVKTDPTATLEPLPDAILAQKDPALGFRTPVVRAWIAKHRPDDYRILYGVPVPEETEAITIEVPVPAKPSGKSSGKSGPPAKAGKPAAKQPNLPTEPVPAQIPLPGTRVMLPGEPVEGPEQLM